MILTLSMVTALALTVPPKAPMDITLVAEKTDIKGVTVGMDMDQAVRIAESAGGTCTRKQEKCQAGTITACTINDTTCEYDDDSNLLIKGTNFLTPTKVKTLQYKFTLARPMDLSRILQETFDGYMLGQCDSDPRMRNGHNVPNCFIFPKDFSVGAEDNQALANLQRSSMPQPKF